MTLQPIESHKRVVRDLYEICLNTGKLDMLPDLIANDFVGDAGAQGPQGFAATAAALRNAFPDIHYDIEDVVADNDRVAVRWKWTGTHDQPFRQFAATHRKITNTGMAMFQIRAGKIARAWVQTDRLGFLQELGVVSADIGGPPARK